MLKALFSIELTAYLDFFVALLAEIAATPCHLCTSHGLLFDCEGLLGLDLCANKVSQQSEKITSHIL